jgi:hypothetical protein
MSEIPIFFKAGDIRFSPVVDGIVIKASDSSVSPNQCLSGLPILADNKNPAVAGFTIWKQFAVDAFGVHPIGELSALPLTWWVLGTPYGTLCPEICMSWACQAGVGISRTYA